LGAMSLGLALVSRLSWGLVWLPVGRLGERTVPYRNIRQSHSHIFHRPTPPYTCTHYTLSGGPANARQAAQHYSPLNSFPRLWDWRTGPTWIRPQRLGGYIGLADATPPPIRQSKSNRYIVQPKQTDYCTGGIELSLNSTM